MITLKEGEVLLTSPIVESTEFHSQWGIVTGEQWIKLEVKRLRDKNIMARSIRIKANHKQKDRLAIARME